MLLEKAIAAMEKVFEELPFGIEHTLRVLWNAEIIMDGENISGDTRLTIALAAVLHDIGAAAAQEKYGSMEGRLQEIEGPAIARGILADSGTPPEITERVCFIVGHHHTFSSIDGIDFQILWEADTLEALLADPQKDPAIRRKKVRENFRTPAGKRLVLSRLGLTDIA